MAGEQSAKRRQPEDCGRQRRPVLTSTFGIESCLSCPSVLPEGESVNACFSEAGQSDSHLILESYGGTILFPLCQLALDIWTWCLARQITLHAEYLPGTENTIADWESRHHQDSSNWELCLSVFEVLNRLLGPFSIDLFTSRSIASLLQLETRSRGTDCRCIFHLVGQGNPLLIFSLLTDW